ncbi:MAG: FAD:protein FMN transferase [Clostridiales bacterium]|nr:FAD:protein FMN transferase [Clostridiales bacterium]
MKNSVKIVLAALLATLAIITQTGCGNNEVSKTDYCLNTTCEIKIYNMSQKEAEELLGIAFKKIHEYENLLSKTVEGSDIYKINNAGGSPVKVSDDTIRVIEQGIYMGDLSGGMFDITIGKVSDMWDFTGENPAVPSQTSIDEALPAVDYRNINIEGNKVTLKDSNSQLDLGGLAKGYIADRIGEFLEVKGVSSAIINLGGNVIALGSKDGEMPWTIGVERPYSDRTEIVGSVEVKDATLVTSGVYKRKFEQNGILYHHILDPNTGFPVDSGLESVTIVAKKSNSCFCDGLSTTCLMLGQEEGMALIRQLQQECSDMGIEAVFIDKNDDMVTTDGFKIKLLEE